MDLNRPATGDWPVIRRVLVRGWRWKWLILASILCASAGAGLLGWLFIQLKPLIELLGQAKDAAQVPEAERTRIVGELWALGWRVLPAAPLAAILAYAAWWTGQLVANRVMQDLRNQTLGHLTGLDLRFHQDLSRGDLITRLTTDLLNTLRLQQLAYGKVLQKPIEAVGWGVALVVLEWRLAVLVAAVLLPAALVIWPLLRRTRDRSQRARDSMERNFGVLEQITAGIKVIKAMGSAEREVARYAGSNAELVRTNMKLAKTRAQSDAVTAFAIFALVGCGLIGCGWLYGKGWVQPASLFLFFGGMARLINLLRETQRGWSDLQEQIPSVERVFALLDRRSRLADPPGLPGCPAPRQAIRLEGVRFRYAEASDEVLRGVDLEIPVGRTTALVGASGGGKSTIIDLLPRFHDVTAGRITWDGVDIRSYRLASIAPHCAMVGQDSFLFDDTILANIAYGKPDATPAEIETAARRANLHDDILRLEGGLGYATRVGDRGGRLSGGQRQRVAIARAFLRDAPILLLDEPTSALDAQSEEHVQAALRELMRGRTVVVVAHRLATVQHADRICVLAGKGDAQPGTIIESGTHAELVAAGGRYAELVRLQQLD